MGRRITKLFDVGIYRQRLTAGVKAWRSIFRKHNKAILDFIPGYFVSNKFGDLSRIDKVIFFGCLLNGYLFFHRYNFIACRLCFFVLRGYPHVEKYAKNGSILDLGCGPGAVGNELNASAYASYTGVDISDTAIEKAKLKNRRSQNHYLQGDILSYVPEQQHDVIIFGDSIYYFRPQRVADILNRYSNYLKPAGVFIVRSWLTHHTSRTIIHKIEQQFDVIEKQLYHDSQIGVLTLRPR